MRERGLSAIHQVCGQADDSSAAAKQMAALLIA